MLIPLLLSEPTGVDPTPLVVALGLGVLLVGLAWWVGLRLVRQAAGWQPVVGSLLTMLALAGTVGSLWLLILLLGMPGEWMALWLAVLVIPSYWVLLRYLSRQGKQARRGRWLGLALLGGLWVLFAALELLQNHRHS